MAQENFKLENDELHQHALAIETAVETYKTLGDKPFKDELDAMEGMNTDFTARLEPMLEDLNDNNEKLVKTITAIADVSGMLLANFEKIDESNVSEMETQ